MTQLPMLTTDGAAPAERGRCHVHFGDWREQEPDWPRPFVYVSDVPYGDRFSRHHADTHVARSIVGDATTAERDDALSVSGWSDAAIFGPGGVRLLATPPWGRPKEMLTWDKGDAGMGDHTFPWRPSVESIAIYGRGWKGRRTSSVLRGVVPTWSGSGSATRSHPHEKPLSVLTELCSKAPPGLPIVDPFMGSGTTAVACALLGREFYGAEIDPQYFDVIRGRLAAVGVLI